MSLKNQNCKISPYCSKCKNVLNKNRHGKYRYCLNCHNAYMRENRVKHRDLPPEARFKANARAYAKVYIKRGLLKKEPCEKCGSMFSECHHQNYNYPLVVNWLCRKCHLQLHKEIPIIKVAIVPPEYFLPNHDPMEFFKFRPEP